MASKPDRSTPSDNFRDVGTSSVTSIWVNDDASRIMVMVGDYDGIDNMSRENAKELIRLLTQALWGKGPDR